MTEIYRNNFERDLEYEKYMTKLFLEPFFYKRIFPNQNYKIINDIETQKKGIDVQVYMGNKVTNIDHKCSFTWCLNEYNPRTYMYEIFTKKHNKMGSLISKESETNLFSLQTISKWNGPNYLSCEPMVVPAYIQEICMINENVETVKEYLYHVLKPNNTIGMFLYSMAMKVYATGRKEMLAPGIWLRICNTNEKSVVLVMKWEIHKKIGKVLHVSREGIKYG